jgi:TP901 family phage tail tape measure protein
MAALVIPTTFTAIDKFSSPMNKMGKSIDSFVAKAEIGVARSERAFRKFTPAISEASSQLLSMVGTAALVSAVFGGGLFAANSVLDYETAIASLSAITGTSGKDLEKFKVQIKSVSDDLKESSVDVANAFTAIGNNQPQLLKDAAGLSAVAKASIILARASEMDLAPASEALTNIMNQYSIAASGAMATTDMLAASAQAGSMQIDATAQSLQKFAPIAVVAGIKINESLALIQTGSKFFKEGTESGTKFLNIITTMASLKVQDPKALADLRRLGVNMDIVRSKTIPFSERLKELKKIGNDIPALFHVFGKENIAMAASVLNSTDAYAKLLVKISETGKAQEMADKNNATLARGWQQLKNKFVTWITTSDEAAKSLSILKVVIKFVTDHLSAIIKTIGLVVGSFILWWTWIQFLKIRLIALRAISTAFFIVDMVKYVAMTNGITFAQAAWAIVVESCTSAFAAFNAMLLANPIGLIIIAIVALTALVIGIVKHWNEWGAAVTLFLGPLGFVISLIQSFRRNWDMIVMAFKSEGIIAGLKAIGKTIIDAVLMPIQQALTLIAKLTGFDWASNAAKSIDTFRTNIGVNTTTDESGNQLPDKPAINTSAVKNEALMNKFSMVSNSRVNIDINDPNNRTKASSPDKNISFNFTSTMP